MTRLDHDANVRPWVQAAQARGATVRWADLDPATGELEPAAVAAVLSRAHAAGGGHRRLEPHRHPARRPGDHRPGARGRRAGLRRRRAPHRARPGRRRRPRRRPLRLLAVQVPRPAPGLRRRRRPELLETLHPDKLLPSTDAVPERFELGTLPYELLAGTTAAVDFLAGLGGTVDGDRRARLVRGLTAVEEHEDRLRVRAGGRRSAGCPASPSGRGPGTARRRCCSPPTGARRPSSRAGWPSATSTRRPARSTRSSPPAGSAWATPAACGSEWRPTPTTRTSTACSPA